MVQGSKVIVDIDKCLDLPTFDASGVREETHMYNGHVHHNMHKACLYE